MASCSSLIEGEKAQDIVAPYKGEIAWLFILPHHHGSEPIIEEGEEPLQLNTQAPQVRYTVYRVLNDASVF